jgi:transposase
MRELTVVEQRYQAVLAVIGDGRTVSEVASQWSVSRQTMHAWLARYEQGGLEGLADRPAGCPHQMAPELVAVVLELRRGWPFWGCPVGSKCSSEGAEWNLGSPYLRR